MKESTPLVPLTRMESSSSLINSRYFMFLSLFTVGLIYNFMPFTSSLIKPAISFHMTSRLGQGDELDGILAETSNENKTLIIALVNKAYVEGDKPMFDLFLNGLWYGKGTQALTDHLLIVACDKVSYQRCKFLRLHCYKLETQGLNFEGEQGHFDANFQTMMWRRTLFLGDVLKRGYNFVFTDTDILMLRNPFSVLSTDETIDLQLATDRFSGNQWSEQNDINTGFYMVRSNNKTISMFDSWYARKEGSTGKKEQDILQMLIRDGLLRRLGVKVRFLDTLYFSNFCEDSRDVGVVVTVHAACCLKMSAKVIDLTTALHDWKRVQGLSANETSTFTWSEHKECKKTMRPS